MSENKCDPKLCSLNVMLIASYLIKYQKKIFNMNPKNENKEDKGEISAFEQSSQYFSKTQGEMIIKIIGKLILHNKSIVKFYTETVLEFYKLQNDKFLEEKKKNEENLKRIDRGSQDEFLKQKEYFKSLVWHMETLADILGQELPDYKSELENIDKEANEVKLSEEEKKYWPYDDIEQK